MVKKIEKKTNVTFEGVNAVTLSGVIRKVIYVSDKMATYSLCNTIKSPKGNNINTFVTIKEFSPKIQFEEGDNVLINGHISCNIYEDKTGKKVYNIEIVGDIETVDVEIPFN